MSWFSKHPHWLNQEAKELSTSSVYKQAFQFIDRTFVSAGVILVHKETTTYHPVTIVYPEATPYAPPKIYILDRSLTEEEIKRYSSLTTVEIGREIKDKTKFHNRRHQNEDGSLCFIETGDLRGDQAESFRIKDILKRVREWLAGKIPRDSREVELFAHFQKRSQDMEYLVPDIFFDERVRKGEFYAGLPRIIVGNLVPDAHVKKIYIGLCIFGETTSGVSLPPVLNTNQKLSLLSILPEPKDIIDPEQRKHIDEKALVRGFWWDISREPQPFNTVGGLAEYVGGDDKEKGLVELARALQQELAKAEQCIFLGLRFPARFPTEQRKYDWIMLRLLKGARLPLIVDTDEERIARLKDHSIEAIRHEYFTDGYFHLRNAGRANRIRLKDQKLSIIGCGALGSEIADSLCKAGVGHVLLTDRDELRAHNSVRHCLGLDKVSWPKSWGLAEYLLLHNPFVEVYTPQRQDILLTDLDEFLPAGFIGVSTIADDNTEAFLNENAVDSGRTVFYCRALRGGKAGRIFRVIPGQDACKACLSLYHSTHHLLFTDIPEDPNLPAITNECNNPVRPGSAADLKIIASLAARVIIECFEGANTNANHWIWHGESLNGLKLGQEEVGAFCTKRIPPHPDCPVCRKIDDTKVSILREALDRIKCLAKESGDIETGGILVGKYESTGSYWVEAATEPGPNAIREGTRFEKDIDYCQMQLEELTREFGEKTCYLGEWHYHPTISNEPSGTDIKSLMEIAAQNNYLIERPIMIIISKTLEFGLSIHTKTGRFVRVGLSVVDGSA
ncbi:MAG: ThiF family adenylyltransferase [Deltaproteobacteria bacterium]|nr:ThiF family adenylyltransferase [Deltaproteobacteria bacterium]